ncbi:MAG: 50S ribosomal protein L24 [Acidobacteria bacterium]|nr:50S ribosomal protein L24 [Acidobacteriota bacterium]
MPTRLKVRKNDQVLVISGRDKGKRGRVIEVRKSEGRVVVEGVNMVKKAVKQNRQRGIAGGIVEREAPIQVSNVMVIDPSSRTPTRIGYQILGDERKVRVARKTGAVIE